MRRAVLAVVCAVIFTALPAPALAANGQLAAVAEGKLVAVNPDGSGLRTLWIPAGGEISGLAWSPDGNKLAFSYQGKITIFDLVERSLTSLPSRPDMQDLDPVWNTTGERIGFRRVGASLQQRIRVGLSGDVVGAADLDLDTTTFSFSPSHSRWAFTREAKLNWDPGAGLDVSSNAFGAPAWAPDETRIAYVDRGAPSPYEGLRVFSTATRTNTPIAPLPAENPRFAPDGTALVYASRGELRTVRPGAAPVAVPGPVGVTSVAWQPCVEGVTASCRSIVPPRCSGTSAQVTTQTDQPVELAAPSCWDPLGQPLSLIVTLPPAHGTVTGTAYTPAPGFTGQDSVTFKVSNGSSESETIRVTIFVVPRPTPSATPPPSATVTATAPFLSLRARPRLNRKRVTVARLTCDQRCTFSVRLDGKVRVKKKTGAIKGAVLKRSLEPGQVLALRLKLPTKPAGTLKTAWITGTVRGATGAGRSVKLPVSVPR